MKYIDADRLRMELEKRLKNVRDYMNGAGMRYKGPKFYKARGKESAYDAFLNIITSLQQEQPDFPTTDEQVKEFLATHPKTEVPEKYKSPDWIFEKSEKPMELEEEVKSCHRTRKKLAEWSKTQEGRESYEKVAEEMRKQIVPNDLEEAAKKHSCYDEDCEGVWYEPIVRNAFIAGADWQKQQMMKEAVDGEYDFYPSAVYLDVPIPRMNHGDKVRIIIVKED